MQSLALENYGTSELSFDEQKETDGGIIPLIPIMIGWGIMAVCSAVAIGFGHAGKDRGYLN